MATSRAFLLLPAASGLLYAISAILYKRTVSEVGPWRMSVVNAGVFAVCFSPLFLLPSVPLREVIWYQPLVLSLFSTIGNLFVFLALTRGDVSVATPIMGTKVVWVALLTVGVLQQSVPVTWWLAAFLSVAGIGLLRGGGGSSRRNVGLTVVYSIASAFFYACGDVFIQKWVTPANFNRWIPLMFWISAVIALGFVPFFRASLWTISAPTWRFLIGGAVMLTLQALGIVYAVSRFGQATAVNVAYSTRGVWSVVLVWLFGHWLAGAERKHGHRVMFGRLVGASLVLGAVVLVLV